MKINHYILTVLIAVITSAGFTTFVGGPMLSGPASSKTPESFTKESAKHLPLDAKAIEEIKKQTDTGLPVAESDGEAHTLRRSGRLTEVDGGVWFNTGVGIPPCEGESMRGVLWFVSRNDGYDDQLLLCARNAEGDIAWHYIEIGPLSVNKSTWE